VPCRRVQRVLAVDAVKKRRANKQTVEKTRTQNDRELTSGFRCQLTAPAHEAASSHLTVSSKPKKTVPEKLRGCSIAIVTMFAVSVMVFPTMATTIQSSSPDPNRWFPMKVCLVWGIGELLGRSTAEGKRVSARAIALPIALRALLIPVFIALRRSATLFGALHDLAAMTAVFAMASSLGFFSSVMTAYASSKATVHEREEAGQYVQFSIATGLTLGTTPSLACYGPATP